MFGARARASPSSWQNCIKISQHYTTSYNSARHQACVNFYLPSHPVLLCLPPSPQATTTGSGSPMAMLCMCTVTWPGRVVESLEGGWEWLNWTWQTSHQCPSGLRQHTDSTIRTCVKNTDSSGCSSVQCFTANIHYSRVCGKVIAYQVGSTNAFRFRTNSLISSAYVDGVSLTHEDPREHIWTFAAALAESHPTGGETSACLCTRDNGAPHPPDFVGMDYFCDTGVRSYSNSPGWSFVGWRRLWSMKHLLWVQRPSMVLQAAATAQHWQHWDEGVQGWRRQQWRHCNWNGRSIYPITHKLTKTCLFCANIECLHKLFR